MTAATDFRQIRLSREVRDWLAAGVVLCNQVASDFAADLEPRALHDLAYALTTVVDEFDAAGGETA